LRLPGALCVPQTEIENSAQGDEGEFICLVQGWLVPLRYMSVVCRPRLSTS